MPKVPSIGSYNNNSIQKKTSSIQKNKNDSSKTNNTSMTKNNIISNNNSSAPIHALFAYLKTISIRYHTLKLKRPYKNKVYII